MGCCVNLSVVASINHGANYQLFRGNLNHSWTAASFVQEMPEVIMKPYINYSGNNTVLIHELFPEIEL
jgi:hypothetical protein